MAEPITAVQIISTLEVGEIKGKRGQATGKPIPKPGPRTKSFRFRVQSDQ